MGLEDLPETVQAFVEVLEIFLALVSSDLEGWKTDGI